MDFFIKVGVAESEADDEAESESFLVWFDEELAPPGNIDPMKMLY